MKRQMFMNLDNEIQTLQIDKFIFFRYQWEEEIRKNLPKVPSYSIHVMNTNKDIIERAKVVILSYDMMATKKDFLKTYGFGVIIMVGNIYMVNITIPLSWGKYI